MFGFGRRRSHGQLVRVELGESFGHFRQAAGHAAEGVGARVGPRVRAAREHLSPTAARVAQTASHGWEVTRTAVVPLAIAAVANARQTGTTSGQKGFKSVTGSKKMKLVMPKNKRKSTRGRRRWSILTGVLAAGAVAGAIGAVAMRRRQQEPWEAYEPARSTEIAREDGRAGNRIADTSTGTGPTAGGPAASASKPKPVTIEKVRDRAATAGEKVASTTGAVADNAKSTAKAAAKQDGLLGTGSTSAGNSRG
ncbi:hypothetical protein ACI2K4_19080 [Micromonospora sp. NPDC050397]|uniref:hypothetical protein n=1 Tax=Micromonospora sp. NPDC050397 TaxID=3364279 RepID=UPI003850F7CA